MSFFAEDYNDTLEFRNLYKKGTYMETPSPLVENTGNLHLSNNGLKLFIIVPESRTASKEAMVYICKNRKVIQLSLRSFSMRAAMGDEIEKGGEDVLLEIEEHQLLGLYCYQSSLFAITKSSITKLDLLSLKKQIIPLPAPLKFVSFFKEDFVYFNIEGHVYHFSNDDQMELLQVSIPSSTVVSISFDGSIVRYLSVQEEEEGSSTFLEHSIKPKISDVAIKELPGVSNANAMMKINDTSFIVSTSVFMCHVIDLLKNGEWNVRTLKNPCNSRLGRKNPLKKKGLYSFISLGPWTIISDSTCGDLAIISDTRLLILESDPFLPQLPLSRDGKMRELMALSMEVDLTSKQRIHHRKDDPDSSTPSLPPQPTLWILSNEYSFIALKIINQDLKAKSLCIDDNPVDADFVCNSKDVKEKVQEEVVKEDVQENETTVKEICPPAKESTKEPKIVQKKEYQNIFHSKDDLLKNTLIKEFTSLSLRMNSLLQLGRKEVSLGRDEVNVLADHLNGLSMSTEITESTTKITSLFNSLIEAEQKLIKSSNELMEMILLLKSRNVHLLEKRIDSVLESISILKKSTTSTTLRKNVILSEIKRRMDSISFILKEGSIVGIASHRNRSTKLNVIEERKATVKAEELSESRPLMKNEEPFCPPKTLFSSVPSIPTTKLIPLDGPECTLVFDDRAKKTITPNVKEIEVLKEVAVKSEIPILTADSTPPIVVVDKPDSVVIKVEEDKNEKSPFDFSDFSPSISSSTPKKVEQNHAVKIAKDSNPSSSLSSLISASVVLPPAVMNTETNVQENIVEPLKPNKEEQEQEQEQEDMLMDTIDRKNTPSPESSSKSYTTFLSASTTKDTNPFTSFSVPKLQSTTAPPIPTFGASASFGSFGASPVTASASFGTHTSSTSFSKAFSSVPSAFSSAPNAFGVGPSPPQQQKLPVFGSSGFGQSIQSVSPFGVPAAAPIKSAGVFGSTSASPAQPSSFSGFASFNNQNNANNIFGYGGGGGSFGQSTKKEEDQKKGGGKLSFTEFRM